MKSILSIALFILIVFVNGQVIASDTYKSGILYGYKNAYWLDAPSGWVLDNQAGKRQGLHAVFYPKNESWAKATGIIYSKAIVKGGSINSIEEYIKFTLASFEKNSPNIEVKCKSEIELNDKRKALIYEWVGDKWGNFESVAYINENHVIVIIVYNCKNEEYYKQNYDKFEQVVKSYKFVTENTN